MIGIDRAVLQDLPYANWIVHQPSEAKRHFQCPGHLETDKAATASEASRQQPIVEERQGLDYTHRDRPRHPTHPSKVHRAHRTTH